MVTVIGRPEPGVRYEDRPAAYAVVRSQDGGSVGVVRSRTGGYFLPGGGAEPGKRRDSRFCARSERSWAAKHG